MKNIFCILMTVTLMLGLCSCTAYESGEGMGDILSDIIDSLPEDEVHGNTDDSSTASDSTDITYHKNGMQITLPEFFVQADYEGFTTCFDSANIAIFCLQEKFDLVEGFESYSLEEYGNLVIEVNGLSGISELLTDENGLKYFTYTFDNNGVIYRYYSYVFKASDCFWMIQFAAFEENADGYYQDFITWANSVTFE